MHNQGSEKFRRDIAQRTVSRLKRFSEQLESGRPVHEKYSCRKIILDIELKPYTADMVREVRQILGLSQALFAKFLNVSTSAVQKWERGASSPDGAACRLLDEIRNDPTHWRRRLSEMAKAVAVGDGR